MKHLIEAALCSLLLTTALWADQSPDQLQLPAPETWTGERISLPPGFAREMQWKGTESIRFAPGMFKPKSESFFSYIFVFQLEKRSPVDRVSLEREFLSYYRGLSKTVLGDSAAKVDFEKFTLKLRAEKMKQSENPVKSGHAYAGDLVWVEPFATKKTQTPRMEIYTWQEPQNSFVIVCVSPSAADSQIWKQLRTIRSQYLKSRHDAD